MKAILIIIIFNVITWGWVIYLITPQSTKPPITYNLNTTMLNDSTAQIEGFNNGARFYIRINNKGQLYTTWDKDCPQSLCPSYTHNKDFLTLKL